MLGLEVRHLSDADSVFAADRSAHCESARDQPRVHGFGLVQLSRIVRVHREDEMKVAIAHMANQRREDAGLLHVGPRFQHALSQT